MAVTIPQVSNFAVTLPTITEDNGAVRDILLQQGEQCFRPTIVDSDSKKSPSISVSLIVIEAFDSSKYPSSFNAMATIIFALA
jgi:hypothetical protein